MAEKTPPIGVNLTRRQSHSLMMGFTCQEAKSWLTWVDKDTLLVGTNWGEGSLTTSGYPREIKRWTRGG